MAHTVGRRGAGCGSQAGGASTIFGWLPFPVQVPVGLDQQRAAQPQRHHRVVAQAEQPEHHLGHQVDRRDQVGQGERQHGQPAAAQLGVLPGHRRAEHPRQRAQPVTEAGRAGPVARHDRAPQRAERGDPLGSVGGHARSTSPGARRFRRRLTPDRRRPDYARANASRVGGKSVRGMGLVSRISAAAVAVLGSSLLVACGGSVADADSDGPAGARPAAARRPARSAPPPGPTRRRSGR